MELAPKLKVMNNRLIKSLAGKIPSYPRIVLFTAQIHFNFSFNPLLGRGDKK